MGCITYLYAVAFVPGVQPGSVLLVLVAGGAGNGRSGGFRRDPHQVALGLADHDEGVLARWDVVL